MTTTNTTDDMWLSGAGEPPTSVWVLCNVARLDGVPVRGLVELGEQRDVAHERHTGAASGGLITPNRDRSGVCGRVEDVLTVPRDGQEQKGERPVSVAAVM